MPAPTLNALKEALALHEILRSLGYPAKDIYLSVFSNGLGITLRHEGKEMAFRASDPGEDIPEGEALVTAWNEALEWWNVTATKEEMDKLFLGSRSRQDVTLLIATLETNGFHPGELN